MGSSDHACDSDGLDGWLNDQLDHSLSGLLKSISATDLVRHRAAFGQTIIPKRGSVVASTVFGDYDPDPDYFFHWFRDSALVMDALRTVIEAGRARIDGHAHFVDFLAFSLSLNKLDGRGAMIDPGSVAPGARQYLRSEAELEKVKGAHALAEARVDPDGTLDVLKWARPQLDGPALRALTLMRYWPICRDERARTLVIELLDGDLDFVLARWRDESYDIWEEDLGHHYYTRLVHLGALVSGEAWLNSIGASARAARFREPIETLYRLLDSHWDAKRQIYREGHGNANKEPDFAVILGVLHAALPGARHSVRDSKVVSTLASLEVFFRQRFEINRSQAPGLEPAMGRYPGDTYFGGNPFYLTTLGAAEFHFRRAEATLSTDTELAQAFVVRGDGYLSTVRKFTPASGEMSEQFDRTTGEQVSARNLAWSYAAFVTAYFARVRARDRISRG